MFDRRMKILLAAFAILGGILIFRLVCIQAPQTQIERSDKARVAMVPLKPIPANRGRILARGPGGRSTVELVVNEPCFEVAVFYPIMDPDQEWVSEQFKAYRRTLREHAKNPKLVVPNEELSFMMSKEVDNFWKTLSRQSGLELDDLLNRRDRTVEIIRRRIQSVRSLRILSQITEMPVGDLLKRPDLANLLKQHADAIHMRQDNLEYQVLDLQRMYYPVIADLENEEAVDLRGRLGNLPWVQVRPSTRRRYLRRDTLCHLLGRTYRVPGSMPKTFEIIDDDYLPGELQGREGLERAYDPLLRGTRGWLELGKEPKIRVEPRDGKDLVLTIDAELQEYCQQRLREHVLEVNAAGQRVHPYATGGAAVVLDVQRSELLALASWPTFEFADFKDRKKYNDLCSDYLRLPLRNRALFAYPPGSIVKPLVGAWAVQQGKVTPNTTFYCQGFLSEKYPNFRCWLHSGHHEVDLIHAIKDSCDIYFYRVGAMLTAEGISEFYKQVGFGRQVPLAMSCLTDTSAETGLFNYPGRVPDPEWFMRRWGRGMSAGDAMNLAIGQGDLEISPLQAAMMMQEVITGRYQPPRIAVGEPLAEGFSIGIQSGYLRTVRDGMFHTLNDSDGTGHSGGYSPDLTVAAAGKTGSAQAVPWPIEWEATYKDPTTQKEVRRIVSVTQWDDFVKKVPVTRDKISRKVTRWFPELAGKDKIDPQSGRERHLSHAWFAGFAPAGKPKVAVVVFIEFGIAGGSGAGPVFRDIMLKCQELGYIGVRRPMSRSMSRPVTSTPSDEFQEADQ